MSWGKLDAAVRDAFLFGAAVFAAGAIVGTVVYFGAAQGLKSEVQQNLIDIAKSAANLTDIAAHQRITRPEDKGNADYESVRRPYFALLRANPDLAYIYTNVERDGKLRFIMDSSIPKPGEKDIPTDVLQDYPDATDTLKAVFAEHKAKVEDKPYTDEWGTFLSAYAPLYDGDTFIGTVGVDIRTNRYLARMAKLQASVALGMIATLIVSIGTGLVVYRFRRKALTADRASAAQALELEQLKDQAIEVERQEAAHALARQRAETERTQAFRNEIERLLGTFGAAADGLYVQARTFADMAKSAGETISRVSEASDDATRRTEHISRSAHELSASIGEISSQSGLSKEISIEAAKQAEEATVALRELNTKSDSVGEVIGLISEIASQINLLALNATIESARAGEAGKGFAVVATEVKNLSNRVAVASQDISRQISDVQAAALHSTEAMERIQDTITKVMGTSQSVASAVSQQLSVTSEIEDQVTRSIRGSYAIAADIAGIRATAEETDKAAQFIEETALKVRAGAQEMAAQIETFARTRA